MNDLSVVYEIRLRGHLDARRASQFEGLIMTLLPTGETLLRGPVVDQAALFGLLDRIRDLALPLISVRRMKEGDDPDDQSSSRSAGGTQDQPEPVL